MSTAYNKGGFVVVAVLLALSARLVFAADHVINQINGCGYLMWNPSAFANCGDNIIKDWVKSQKFYVGDRILFYFDPDDSNVEEVNEEDYNGCTSGDHTKPESPKSMNNASPVNFTLEARTYYFVSAIPSKPSCQSELALSFTVLPTLSSSSPPPQTAANPPDDDDDDSPRDPISSSSNSINPSHHLRSVALLAFLFLAAGLHLIPCNLVGHM